MEAAFQVVVKSVNDMEVLQERVKMYMRSEGPYNLLESMEYKRFMLDILGHLKRGTRPPDRCFLDRLGMIMREGECYTLYVETPSVPKGNVDADI